MDFRPSKASVWLCILVAALASRSASGQQSIDFSKPADEPAAKDNPILTHETIEPEGLRPPSSLFVPHPKASFDILPGSPPPAPISPQQAMQWQRLLDDKKNWTLMTPEEIMGVPTAEKILGLPESADDKNLTAEERYMKRMDKQRTISATAALRSQDGSLFGENLDPFRQTQPGDDSSQDGNSKSDALFGQVWGRSADSSVKGDSVAVKPKSIWNSAFPRPPAMPKPNLEQVAEMERFERLLGSLEPEKPTTMATAASFLQPESHSPDPNMEEMQAFNSRGKSFTPIRDTAIKPVGIRPLYGIDNRPTTSAKKPDPLTKRPPWLSNEIPAPGTQPRVF